MREEIRIRFRGFPTLEYRRFCKERTWRKLQKDAAVLCGCQFKRRSAAISWGDHHVARSVHKGRGLEIRAGRRCTFAAWKLNDGRRHGKNRTTTTTTSTSTSTSATTSTYGRIIADVIDGESTSKMTLVESQSGYRPINGAEKLPCDWISPLICVSKLFQEHPTWLPIWHQACAEVLDFLFSSSQRADVSVLVLRLYIASRRERPSACGVRCGLSWSQGLWNESIQKARNVNLTKFDNKSDFCGVGWTEEMQFLHLEFQRDHVPWSNSW